jgi:hypothetical protein
MHMNKECNKQMSQSFFNKQVRDTQNELLVRVSSTYQASFLTNLVASILLAALAVIIGAIIDNLITKWQKNTTNREECLGYFWLQLFIDIFLLVFLARFYQPFIPWLQLTVAGIFSGVLFFSVQERLSVNALCVVKI